MKKNEKKVDTNVDYLRGITVGFDPESHIFDTEKNKMVSTIPILNANKDNPIDLGDDIKFYSDNILAESSFRYCTSRKEIFERFHTVFNRIQKKLGKRYKMVQKAAYVYDEEELKDPKAWEIGCNQTLNAYRLEVNDITPYQDGTRTTGFHIHFGHKDLGEFSKRINAIKCLDIFLGCGSVLYDKDESSVIRRNWYGKGSEHRVGKGFAGFEYRCLGPFTITSQETLNLALDLASYSIGHVFAGTDKQLLKTINPEDVINAINKCNHELAESVLLKAKLPESLMQRVRADYSTDFYKNWDIRVD